MTPEQEREQQRKDGATEVGLFLFTTLVGIPIFVIGLLMWIF